MALVTLPRQYTANINGEPRVGARLFVYDATTNNTRTVYTTKAFSIELSQPIQSMEGGIFPAIYVNPEGGDFKLVIQDSDGAPIYTEDNVPAQLGATDIDLVSVATASQSTPVLYSLRRTPAEQSAAVTPVNYAYAPEPVVDARRYGFNIDASEAVNTNAVEDAIRALQKTGGFPGGTIQLPPGGAGINDLVIPWYVLLRGLGRSTQLNYSGSGTALMLGTAANTGALQYGCGVSNLAVILSHKDATGVYLRETRAAKVRDLYIEGPATAGRTNRGVVIDGGDASSHDNDIANVICNHIENGYVITTTGGQRSTINKFDNCSVYGDVGSVGTNSVGLSIIANGRADGTTWVSGCIEGCGTGMFFDATALPMSVFGTRFEGNTKDIILTAGCKPVFFFGLQTDSAYNVTDVNNVGGFYGCATVSGSRWGAQGTFAGALTGFASDLPVTVEWRKTDRFVELFITATVNATSNATTMTLTGLPSGLIPNNMRTVVCSHVEDSGQNITATARIETSGGIITFLAHAVASSFVRPSATGFTGSASKGLQAGWTIQYDLG